MGSCKLHCAIEAVLCLALAVPSCSSDDGPPHVSSTSTGGASGASSASSTTASSTVAGDATATTASSSASVATTVGGSGGGGGSGGSGGDAGSDPSGSGGGPATSGAGGGAGSSGAGGGSPGSLAVCWPDSTVVKICHQLENACENCPPGGPGTALAKACFALVEKAYAGMADDAACEKFAIDNKCKVDDGGNVCGSLNCDAPGCMNKTRCADRKGWGDSSQCQPFLATCPCK
jgi:hypothetical protein